MKIQQPGKVTDKITLLGRRESNVYFLDGGSQSALIGGGMAYIVPDVMDQIRDMAVDVEKIKRIVILHSHFDHCGIVPFFKKQWPWAKVAASAPAKALLVKPKVVEAICAMNHEQLKRHDRLHIAAESGFADFSGIEVEDVLEEGQKIVCGDLTLEILEVPGHSPCSVAVYVPEQKALFASDAGGIALGDEIFTAANSDFDKYQQSLEKMAALDVDVYLGEHYGARTQQEAKEFLQKSARAAADFRRQIEQALEQNNDPQQAAKQLTAERMQKAPSDFLPEKIIYMIIGQMVNFVSKKQGRS